MVAVVVEDEEGAALVVAVVVEAPVLLLVSVDALVVDAADVSAVVELLLEDVVWPQAAIAARAPAAAKLKIKRMASPPVKWDEGAIGAQSVRRLGAT